MSQEISLSVGESSLHTNKPFLALQLLQYLCPEIAAAKPIQIEGTLETIAAEPTLKIGDRIDGCVVFARHWIGGAEFALIDLGETAEIEGAWGKRDQEVETNHGDGFANTKAMAEAGSALANKALEAGAYIPSAAECHLLMYAKQMGLVTDLREDVRYWTSSQYSAYHAYTMDFEGGWQGSVGKDLERPARLVRRIPIIR
ncbi:hypothetical protein [Pseudomonas sp. UBA7530]|uniref:hypothetical protein n=1 Tax=Pseudomonas sp. UBA7530 TaxID=1947341 RepID=UPI0025D4ED5A|nr:hypothetical protein [Pseudomonas sp. UBA7530]